MAGLLDWVDPAREWFKSRPEVAKGLLGAVYQLATDPQAREAAMARAPKPFTDESAAKYQASAEGFWNPAGLLGTFAGVNAKTANKAALEVAQKMDRAGADRGAIWNETGWFKGPDSKWRFEIDDSAATHRPYQFTPAEAYKNAKNDAIIYNEPALFDRVHSMAPYVSKTRNQLTEEYKTTGGMIVDAAKSGNKEEAKRLVDARRGLDNILGEMGNRPFGPMSSYLKHGELGAAYPDVYKIHTRVSADEAGDFYGQYRPEMFHQKEQIVLSEQPRFSRSKSTALHELQHAIQRREGFATGGTPAAMEQAYNSLRARLNHLEKSDAFREAQKKSDLNAELMVDGKITEAEWTQREAMLKSFFPEYSEAGAVMDKLRSMKTADPNEAYRRLAGEAEARATQARMNMTPLERKAKAPWESYDIPWDQLIVRY